MRRKMLCLVTSMVAMLVLLVGCAGTSAAEQTADYGNALFDASYVHRIDVRISEEDWNDLLSNPLEKTKYKVDIEIDGELVEEVSFATKGNSSLAFVAADGDTRFSYKVNFGKFRKGQTYYGLNKLNLNNCFSDTTYMKDFICYSMFREVGVNAPLTSYVWLTVNGVDRGLYLAVEDESEGFLDRVYGGECVIYKPESSDLGLTLDKVEAIRQNGLPIASDTHGSDLVYTDDNPDSYPDIFRNNETKSSDASRQAVVAALKNLATQTDLESCLDTEEIISYFAVHNFVLNFDSYTAGMLHNLVLCESNGMLSILPWDYNSAFATFVSAITDEPLDDPTDVLNMDIDSPLFGVDEESRPMWAWIVRSGEYLNRYHAVLDRFVADYIESGRFEEEARAVHEMLLPYVEKDPTAFCSADECSEGYKVLVEFCKRRAQSVRWQLDELQQPKEVDASDLDVSRMGGSDWVW
ncbi:MAG: CotH kinase family protein [Spirochaetales bacterium]|nr:CotH kinase family protein [Spirochaetales bacterium]